MSDIPVSLVEKLAATYTGGPVYLPPRVREPKANATVENVAGRPEVRAAAEAYFEDPERLHGDRVAEQTILTEQPIHRMMVYLHSCGATAADIAQQTSYSKQYVTQVLRQPWARSRLVQLLNETGRDMVEHFKQHQVLPSLEVLQEIRDDAKVAASARINAANSILDRALGKPTVHVQSDNTNRSVPADVQRLDAELAAVRKQLEEKGASVPGGN